MIEKQKGGHLKFLVDQENSRCVTLITKGQLGTAFATTKQL